jgi:hypothetical protein
MTNREDWPNYLDTMEHDKTVKAFKHKPKAHWNIDTILLQEVLNMKGILGWRLDLLISIYK